MGTKLFALPWSVLTLDASEKRFILDVSKEKLESAEGFDKDHWPAMADTSWATRLHEFYNVPPYWRSEYAGPTPAARRSRIACWIPSTAHPVTDRRPRCLGQDVTRALARGGSGARCSS